MDIVTYALSKRYTNRKIDDAIPLLADLPEKVAELDRATEEANTILVQFPIISEDDKQEVRVLEDVDIDPTLSVAGKVADAKAVGDKIEEILVALRSLGVNI